MNKTLTKRYPGNQFESLNNMAEKQVERFDVRMHPAAFKEYDKLKQPALEIVNKSIDELVYRADEVGKPLGNKREMKLAGCKEIKLRAAGIRIIFRILQEKVEVLQVVQIITIEKRSRDYAFKLASARLNKIKSTNDLPKSLKDFEKWNSTKEEKE